MEIGYEGGGGAPTQGSFTPVAPVQPAVQPVQHTASLAGPPVPPQQYGQVPQAPQAQVPTAPAQTPEGVVPQHPTPVAPQQVQQQQQPAVAQQLEQLATDYGFAPGSFAQFTSVQDAQAAAQLYLSQIAQSAYQQPQVQQQQYVQPQVPQQVVQQQAPAELPQVEIDEQLLDPKVAATVKALAARTEAALQQAAAATQRVAQYEKQQLQALEQQLQTRSLAAIDKLASAKYGVGSQRSFTQQLAVKNLLGVADALSTAIYNQTGRSPQIEQIIRQAILLDGGGAQPPAPQPAPVNTPFPQPAYNIPALPPAGAPTGAGPVPQVPVGGYFTQPTNTPFYQPAPPPPLERDADFTRLALAVLARPGG